MLLVEMAALFGQVHGFALGDVFEVNNGVGDAALRPEDEALQVSGFPGIGIADLRIFGDGKLEGVRNGPCPFNGAGNGAAVSDGDNFVVALGEGRGGGEPTSQKEKW